MSVSSVTNNNFTTINTQETASTAQIKAQTSLSAAGSAASGSSAVLQEDNTRLSAAAEILSPSALSSDAPSARVAELQAAIAAGTYNVPASALADKLIQSIVQ